jgi:hypothetical protein
VIFHKLELIVTEATTHDKVVLAKLVVVSVDDKGNRVWVQDIPVEIPIPEGYAEPNYVVTPSRRTQVFAKPKLLTLEEARNLFFVKKEGEGV